MSTKKVTIHLWHGGNTYSIYEDLNFWKKSFREKYNDLNILTYSEQDYTEERSIKLLNHAVNSQSLFGETKLVILKNLLSTKKINPEVENSILSLLKNPSGSTFLLFIQSEKIENKEVHGAIEKLFKKGLANVKEYPLPLTTQTLATWLGGYAKKNSINIDQSTIKLLIEKSVDLGGFKAKIDTAILWTVTEELNKLHAFTGGKEITQKTVTTMETNVHHDALWDLLGALMSGNKKTAASLLHKRLHAMPVGSHGAELRTLLTLLSGQVNTLLAAKRLSPTAFNAYAKKARFSKGRLFMISKQANSFTEESLKSLQKKTITLFLTSVTEPKILKAQFSLLLL